MKINEYDFFLFQTLTTFRQGHIELVKGFEIHYASDNFKEWKFFLCKIHENFFCTKYTGFQLKQFSPHTQCSP